MSEEVQTPIDSVSQFERSLDATFFYSSESGIRAIDDRAILSSITKAYPQFNLDVKDLHLRKILLLILADKDLIHNILSYYLIGIQDLFRILNKDYGSLFNTIFIKKVKALLEQSDYDKYKSI